MSKRAKKLVRLATSSVRHPRVNEDGRRVAVHKAEFTRVLKQARKDRSEVFFDQCGRCYVPAPSEWLRELDVANDPDVQQLQLRVMLVDVEPKCSGDPSILSERKSILIPGDVVYLRLLATSRKTSRFEDMSEMSVFATHGHARSRCFVVYLQDETL